MPSGNPDRDRCRVAIVGAGGAVGGWVREALAAHGVAGHRVDLFGGSPGGETVLSEYAGEARVLQSLEPDSLDGHDLVISCEAGPRLRVPERSLLISLFPASEGSVLVHEPLRPRPESVHRVRVPDSIAVVLAELLAPLRSFAPRSVSAVVLRPAAAHGAEGLDELREQTVRLLRFESPPTEVFGKPLAFNLIPEPFVSGAPTGVGRIAADVTEILGPGAPEVTARMATAPWFHGHVLFVRLQGLTADRTGLRDTLSGAQSVELLDDGSGFTAADGPEERRTVVFHAEREGDGAWILALAAEAETAAARQAVAVAAAAGRL